MADRYTVNQALETLKGNFARRDLPDAMLDLWFEKLRPYTNNAVVAALDKLLDEELQRFPQIGGFIPRVRQEEARIQEKTYASKPCPKCENRGMTYTERKDGELFLVTCDCPIGIAKNAYLERERKEGYASNKHKAVSE